MARIGSCWAQPSWADPAWAPNTWANVSGSGLVKPPTPTLLLHDVEAKLLTPIGDDGFVMATPLVFTRTETGAITFKCSGSDGTVENLATATSATFSMVSSQGVVKVNARPLTNKSAAGTGTWTRTTADVDTAGDYIAAVRVLRTDGSIGIYPDGQHGMKITILPLITD